MVNSYNEWDPLEEVILGSGIPEDLPALDFTFKLFFHDNIYGKHIGEPGQEYITKKHIAEHNQDLENFADLLKSLGIRVKRPKKYNRVQKTKTLAWESSSSPSLNCRDMCMIVGSTIIESAPTCRWRYFENDYLKHIFLDYFKNGSSWICAPKPIMVDSSFDLSFFENSHPGAFAEYNQSAKDHALSCEHEIMFDAANCMRMGSHILMNVSNKNQRLGAQWLESTLGAKYTVWKANICDNHIDSEFLPLRPGLALITLPEILDKLPEPLQKWDIIYVPEIKQKLEKYKQNQSTRLASPKIDYNILSISPEALICSPECQKTLESKLKKHGIECIPSSMRHADIFAGGHHCVTLDTIRKGGLENYF